MKFQAVQRVILTAATLTLLSGCTLQASDMVDPRSCNPSTSFTRGMNDGTAAGRMDSDYINLCPENSRNAMQQAYRDGYMQGRETRREDERSEHPASSAPDVNINVGHQRPGNGKPTGAATERQYFCKVKTFGTEYSAFGRTELETRLTVQKKCEAGNGQDSMFCRAEKIDCQVNK